MNIKLYVKSKLSRFTLAIMALFFSSSLFCEEYKTARKIEDVCELQNLNAECLIVFDVDNVLIASNSAINRPIGDALRDRFRKEYFSQLSLQERNELQSLIWLHQKFHLTDTTIPSVIHQLQRQKIPVIALTALGTGSFGVIADMADYRIDQLNQFSIDFDKSAPKGHFIFDELKEVYGNFPVYKKGILFTNWYQNNKGDVLLAYLEKANLKPKKVIFFDDSIANLNSVGEKLAVLDIEFVGIQYLAETLSSDYLDAGIAKKQFEHLCKYKKWLDEEEIIKAPGELTLK